jgi:fatty acid desaturase
VNQLYPDKTNDGIRWPIIFFWISLMFSYVLVALVSIVGHFPLFIATLINTVICYYLFVVMHEAIHGNVNGGIKKFKFLNKLVGHSSSVFLGLPFLGYGKLHIAHHRYANSKLDPDSSCSDGAISIIEFPTKRLYEKVVVCFPGGIKLLKKTLGRREAIFAYLMYKDKAQVNFYRATFVLFLSSYMFGKLMEFTFIWLFPTFIFPYLVFVFLSWFPHISYSYVSGKTTEAENQNFTAKNNKFVFGFIFTGLHHKHLNHHLKPSVPFYKLNKVKNI